ncbi:hypothetical protein C8T65DRAFT_730299, partial [Cerioporus squamosus]
MVELLLGSPTPSGPLVGDPVGIGAEDLLVACYPHPIAGYEVEGTGSYLVADCREELSDNYLTMVEPLLGSPPQSGRPVRGVVQPAPMASDICLENPQEFIHHAYAQTMLRSVDAYGSAAVHQDTYYASPFLSQSAYIHPAQHEASSSCIAPSLIASPTLRASSHDVQYVYPSPSPDAQYGHPSSSHDPRCAHPSSSHDAHYASSH